MFIINLLILKETNHVAAEVNLTCPNQRQADIAEDKLFYGEPPGSNMLLARVDPTTVRMKFIDYGVPWETFIQKDENEKHLSYQDILQAKLPSFATIDHMTVEPRSISARVQCDVPDFDQLDLMMRRAS